MPGRLRATATSTIRSWGRKRAVRKYAGQAQQAQYGGVLAHDGQERAQDHGQVEEIPRIPEELPGAIGVHGQSQQDLDGEGGQTDVLGQP